MNASFDDAGRRTQVIIPNVTLNYTYDALGRMTSLSQGTTLLDTFSYASNGLVSNRSEGASGASSVAYTWDDTGRLTRQSYAFSSGTGNISRAFGYNPASQIVADTKSNASYAFPTSQVGTVNRDYGVNGLNQYTATSTAGTTTASFT